MKIYTSLYDSCFRRELASAIEQDLQSRYPSLSSDWLTYSLHLNSSIAQVIDIFIQEVNRGHIFYDDLFGTTFKKYVESDIPFYCSVEIPRLLCYDFCMMYLSYVYPFINEIYRMQQMTDFVTRAEFRSVYESPNTLMNAIKKQKNTILDKMEKSKQTIYLNTQTYNYSSGNLPPIKKMEQLSLSKKNNPCIPKRMVEISLRQEDLHIYGMAYEEEVDKMLEIVKRDPPETWVGRDIDLLIAAIKEVEAEQKCF